MTSPEFSGAKRYSTAASAPVSTCGRRARLQDAELVALGVGQYDPADVGTLADVNAPRAEPDDTLNLRIAIVRIEVNMQPILQCLFFGNGDKA